MQTLIIYGMIVGALLTIIGAFLSTEPRNKKAKKVGIIFVVLGITIIIVDSVSQLIAWQSYHF